MANLTVRAFAELIHTPLYGQIRILREQKYPRRGPAIFKIRYYRPVLQLIARYYGHDNERTQFPTNANDIPGIGGNNEPRIAHNFRCVRSFLRGDQSSRQLSVMRSMTLDMSLGNVTIRATPDLTVREANQNDTRFLLYDCRIARPEEEIIRTTVELFHHILMQNDVHCALSRIEYIHLEDNSAFQWSRPRRRTIERAMATAIAINTLWDSI